MENFISINISYIRKKNYLSRKELGGIYGVSDSMIGNYEREKNYPTVDFIQKFCRDYNINIDDFFNIDLSEVREDYVKEVPVAYEKNTIQSEHVAALREIIATKDEIIAEKNKSVELLERTNETYKVLMNQNDGTVKLYEKIMDRLDRDLVLDFIDREMERTDKILAKEKAAKDKLEQQTKG